MSTRQFSIPYNGLNPDVYLDIINPYKKNIENIFFGINSINNNHQVYDYKNYGTMPNPIYEKNTFNFLEKSNGLYKRILTLNSGHYSFITDHDMYKWCDNTLFPFLNKYNVEASKSHTFIINSSKASFF